MLPLNFGTVMLNHLMVQAVCAVVVTLLWRSNRGRYDGLGFWVADFWLHTAAISLLLLRGHIPLFLSAVGGNACVLAGAIFLYAGLARFAAIAPWPRFNLALFPAFLLLHSYFTVIEPSLSIRTANASFFLAAYCANIIILLRRYPSGLRKLTAPAAYAIGGLAAVSLLRAALILQHGDVTDIFHSHNYDVILFMLYSASMVMLAYGLFLMVNRRLLADTRADYEGRMEAEKALSGALKVARLGTWRWDIKTGQLSWSEEMYSVFGLSKDKFSGDLGAVIAAAIHPDDRAAVDSSNRSVMEKGLPQPLDYRVIWPDGSVHWVHAEASELEKDPEGRPAALKGYAQDITERKKAEAELRASEERFQKAFRAAPFLMSLSEIGTGRYIEVNDKFCEVTGFSRDELIGRTSTEIGWISPEARARLVRESNGSSLRIPEITLTAKGGRSVVCSYACERVSMGGKNILLAIAEDITSLKKAESAMLVAQKLEALGTLAGGIAHDFNNLLTGITGNLSLIRAESAAGKDVAELTAEAEGACSAARALARQLLTFATGGEPVKVALDLPALIKEAVAFSLRGSGTRYSVSGGEGLAVLGDKEQLFQVFQNLALNAAQTMGGGGEVKASVRREELSEGAVPGLSPGAYVLAEVADSGGGMTPEVLSRIFEPYFSTKGQGRGLGLAVCRSVVAKHGGQISAVSAPGKGSVFSVRLPLTGEKPAQAAARPPELKAGTGRILIMDDEEIVYKALKRMLTSLGYEAEVVKDGEAALAAWEAAHKAGRPFSAAVMDLTIPGGMGGAETVRLLKAKFPSAKALVSSGYAEDPVMSDHSARGFDGALSKPYRVEDLAAVLDKLLR